VGVGFKKEKIFSVLIVFSVFVLSIIISPFYVLEDQEVYRKVYSEIQGKGLIEAYAIYKSQIFTNEIGHFFLIWLISDYFDKDLIMALINSALAYFSIKILRRYGAHFLVVFSVVVLGYYSWVLFLSAERLKISVAFLMVAIYLSVNGKRKSSFFLYLFSLITHLQNLVVVSILLVGNYFNDVKRALFSGRVSRKNLIFLSISFFSLIIVAAFFSSHILSKISAYNSDKSFVDFLRISLFLFASLYYGHRDVGKVVLIFSVLYVAIFFVGGERINIIGYYVFLYFCLRKRQGINVGFFLVTGYYFLNLINYLSNVFQCGSNNPC
tara:strand:- start:25940 stop:26911 length:972 start_codon:yes stop_codon:yes gene_type:complete